MKWWWAAGAAAASAVLWRFGFGLNPVPGLAVLAPLPVLLVAPRLSAKATFLIGFGSWLAGALASFWSYLVRTVEQPVPNAVALIGISALVYAGAVVLWRALLRRGHAMFAVLALPATWVAFEFLLALTELFGAWWSLAYTQAGVLPLLQTASLTGPWGISFLILLVPAVIGLIATSGIPRRQRIRVGAAAAVVLTATCAFGVWQLAAPQPGKSVRVGLLAVSQPPEYVAVDSAAGRDMISRVGSEIERLADQGAQVVVLPEKAWRADESSLPVLGAPLTELATRRGIHIVAGLILTRDGHSVNAAIDYPSGVEYAKHYLITGLEDDLEPGTEWQRVPGEPWALAVCFDLDRPALVRENARRGATLMLVPALDFTVDAWLHSRMAVLRGIESGVAVARAPQLGEHVASDARGRIHAAAATDIGVTRSVLATLPLTESRTVYARFGDWFGWLCVALCAAALLVAVTGRIRRSGARD
ncbi:nitrilase-related carbon-nitrogen hydrolase [Nocardia sp. NPDC051832]|uniref:nitrilase-related carbon-nitrogen hydrolase n=1 Tax=Nocardia sp. NPDC051832 TaxID=3155673 RepID=UPI00342B4E9F